MAEMNPERSPAEPDESVEAPTFDEIDGGEVKPKTAEMRTLQKVASAVEALVIPPKEKGAAALIEIGENGIMLRSLDDLLRFARLAVEHGAAPKGMTEGQAALAIQAGLERHLGPLAGLSQCVVINGLLSWRGQAAYALIQNSKVCVPGTLMKWLEGEGENKRGVAVAHRVGYKAPSRSEFSVKDAKQARLWGKAGPWQDFPDRQLQWRALGFLARDIFPDVLGGFPLAEEAIDFEPAEPEKPPLTSRPALSPPSSPDPLFEALKIGPAKVETTDVKPAVQTPQARSPFFEGPDRSIAEIVDASAEAIRAAFRDTTPFASHEEADKELAKEESQLEFPE